MTAKYKVKKDIFTSTKPNYYKINNKHDLFDLFDMGLLSHEENVGFCKGSFYKYAHRYKYKGQKEADLNKMIIYAKRLKNLEIINQKGSR